MKYWLLLGVIAFPLVGKAAETVSVRRDVPYGDPVQPSQLDAYLPARAAADPPVPAIIWIPGDAGAEADTAASRTVAMATGLADAGYVCARLHLRPRAPRDMGAVLDCKNAVRFLRLHAADFHLDPARIAVLGEGRGGEVALWAGLTVGDPRLEPGRPYPETTSEVSAIAAFNPVGLAALAKRVLPDAPPLLLVEDLGAASASDREFEQALTAQGIPHQRLAAPVRITLEPAVRQFLGQYLGAAPHGLTAVPPPTPRLQINLDDGWRFFAHDHRSGPDVDLDESGWSPVNLPHTWNAQDGQDGGGNYYRGPAWYRRHWQWTEQCKGKQLYLQFDGASQQADVYVNGKKLGSHLGGFARFRFDATEAFHPGDNIIAVRVDNGRLGIPPILGDFTFFGGLYRSVSLIATDPIQISMMDYGSPGVFVDQNAVSGQRADITIRTEVENYEDKERSVEIVALVLDAAGHPVARAEAKQRMAGGDEITAVQKISIRRPHLWDGTADPYLYTVMVTVRANGTARDSVTQPLGLRFLQVDPARGFLLNGHPVDLHGVTRHQDHLDEGWAIGAADEAEDFALLRELGANAVRVMNYQASDTWYQRLDRSGVITTGEVPVIDVVRSDPAYLESAKQQLRELIRQNYNHPSICFWGVGDSTRDEPPKPEAKTAPKPDGKSAEPAAVTELPPAAEPPVRRKIKAAANDKPVPPPTPGGQDSTHLIAELALLAKSEDSVRLSVYESSGQDAEAKNWQTDALGLNRFAGWYAGSIAGLGAHLDGIHQRHPHSPIGISAFGAGASVFEHQLPALEPVVSGRLHPEEYQSLVHEQTWPILSARPYLWSKFVWALCDFASDGRPDGDQPGRVDVGLVTFDRRVRKDAYFFYKANWSAEPVVSLTSRRFLIRHRPFTDIKVYSNAPEVELFVNGRSLGRLAAADHVFRWKDVALLSGENHAAAHGQFGGLSVSDGCTWIYEPVEAPAPHSTPR